MTYLVGYSPHKDDTCALSLAVQLARSESDTVHAVTVVPKGWATSAGSRNDGEFATWAHNEGEASAKEALAFLAEQPDIAGAASWVTARSAPAALLEQVEALEASILIVGSGVEGPEGKVTVTSKTDRLLHSSDIPVAIAPRGYCPPAGSKVESVTVAFRDDDQTWKLLDRVAEIARRTGAKLRLVTIALQHKAMVTSAVRGFEELVFEEVREQAQAAQDEAVAHLSENGFAAGDIETLIVEGSSWGEAMEQVSWYEGDVLVVGSSSTHPLTQVFLGSSAAKIVRNSPVPVIVVP
ncbi:MAG: universal stress protein [Phycicoccus sp.]|nr:universal stress protein [Phycicoccus sp.]